MAWIELHQSLPTHRRTMDLCDELEIDAAAAIGHLVCLWLWAIDNAPDGSLAEVKPRTIARAALWTGDPDIFIAALLASGFLDPDHSLHDWWDYAHLTDREKKHPVRQAWEAMAKRIRPQVLARDGNRCQSCGATTRLEVDHIQPIAKGGTNDFTNLRALCLSCNRRKGARL